MRSRSRIAFVVAVVIAATTARAHAQTTSTEACPADEVVGWVGLRELECNCTEVGAPRTDPAMESHWRFRSEPVIGSIAPGSPAENVLRSGDVIVAVNGHLITTSEGGRRFSQPPAGHPMALRIRREGREMTVRVTPVALCPTDERLAVQAPRAPEAPEGRRVPRPRVPGMRAPAPSAAPPLPLSVLPAGHLGFGITCSSCAIAGDATNEEVRLTFDGPLQVYSVEPGSPADRAGLRRGDVITHVDGLAVTTEAGARRFAAIEPDETVRYTIRRGTATEIVTLRAADRTAGRLSQRELRLRLERISRLRDPEEAQRQIVELAREVEALAGRQVTGTFGGGDANRLRYSGQVGDAEVEVRGSGSVIATVLEPDRDLRIVTDEMTIRIRVPREGGR